jgi:lipopolysaccharide transport system ATP-binding protein
MNDVVIRVEGLGKKYLIGHKAAGERYVALRDVIARTARGFLQSAKDMAGGRQLVAGDEIEEYWALKEVGFDIKRGDVVGVIGRNGAGKSTLLKILSRITEPSEGRVEIRGRVASLLEVGTGFHPELSGRENIFLNGAILGMSRIEIWKKFDEIVAFAEVEKFLDTPVKRYSSGMYVRLAFAVAAHLEPEILVVDEVLAVGDAEFQKKCIGKMEEVAGLGRTVIFVSHNMNAINTLCKNAIFLKSGKIIYQGEVREAISRYLSASQSSNIFKRNSEIPLPPVYVLQGRVEWLESDLKQKLQVIITINSDSSRRVSIDFRILDNIGAPICFSSIGAFNQQKTVQLREGANSFKVAIDVNLLAKGSYRISIDVAEPNVRYFDRVEDFLKFDLDPLKLDPGTYRCLEQSWGFGSVYLPAELLENQGPGP